VLRLFYSSKNSQTDESPSKRSRLREDDREQSEVSSKMEMLSLRLRDAVTHSSLVAVFADVAKYLLSLSPAALDAELRVAAGDEAYEEEDMGCLLEFFMEQLKLKQDFEFCQASLSLVLQVRRVCVRQGPFFW